MPSSWNTSSLFSHRKKRVYIAGHKGLIGSAFERRLRADGFDSLITVDRKELDLTDALKVKTFFHDFRPDWVILAAGRVGGIIVNRDNPFAFIRDNLAIQLNVMNSAHESGVGKLLFFCSSCMYPKVCPQPMSEASLLSGHPEATSMAYAMAKLAGLEMCLAHNRQFTGSSFLPVIPNNAYGPGDDFEPSTSHVLSALIRRFHEAKIQRKGEVILWGTGKPRREFVFVDDIVDASLLLLSNDSNPTYPINIGVGEDYSIQEIATKVAGIVGFKGAIINDASKPDGAPRKLLDSSRLFGLGWRPQISLVDGLQMTYDWYLKNGEAL